MCCVYVCVRVRVRVRVCVVRAPRVIVMTLPMLRSACLTTPRACITMHRRPQASTCPCVQQHTNIKPLGLVGGGVGAPLILIGTRSGIAGHFKEVDQHTLVEGRAEKWILTSGAPSMPARERIQMLQKRFPKVTRDWRAFLAAASLDEEENLHTFENTLARLPPEDALEFILSGRPYA